MFEAYWVCAQYSRRLYNYTLGKIILVHLFPLAAARATVALISPMSRLLSVTQPCITQKDQIPVVRLQLPQA